MLGMRNVATTKRCILNIALILGYRAALNKIISIGENYTLRSVHGAPVQGPTNGPLFDNITIFWSSLNPTAAQPPLPLNSNSSVFELVVLYVTRKSQLSVQEAGNIKHPFPDPQSAVLI